jgi:uncharacterized membrane protein YdbT with pleckstrin-like domain
MAPDGPPRVAPAFVLKYLLPSERCVIAVRRHPAQLILAGLITAGALLLAFLLDSVFPPHQPYVHGVIWFSFLVVGAWFAWKMSEWWADYFIVTDKRLMLTTGLITRKVNMMPLSKVTDMSFKRPFAGRLLGYGVFVMESAGQDQALNRIDFVPDPDAIYLEMCDLLFGPSA